jgi:hypothetical protein
MPICGRYLQSGAPCTILQRRRLPRSSKAPWTKLRFSAEEHMALALLGHASEDLHGLRAWVMGVFVPCRIERQEVRIKMCEGLARDYMDKHVLVESGGEIPGLRCITGFRRGLKASGFEEVFHDLWKGRWHGLTGLYICGGSDYPFLVSRSWCYHSCPWARYWIYTCLLLLLHETHSSC